MKVPYECSERSICYSEAHIYTHRKEVTFYMVILLLISIPEKSVIKRGQAPG